MPKMDGYQAAAKIKSLKEGKTTSIIAVSANVFEEDRSKAIAAGCDDFLGKPFKEEELFDVINRYIKVEYDYIGKKTDEKDVFPETSGKMFINT